MGTPGKDTTSLPGGATYGYPAVHDMNGALRPHGFPLARGNKRAPCRGDSGVRGAPGPDVKVDETRGGSAAKRDPGPSRVLSPDGSGGPGVEIPETAGRLAWGFRPTFGYREKPWKREPNGSLNPDRPRIADTGGNRRRARIPGSVA